MKVENQYPESVKFWNSVFEATDTQSGLQLPYRVAKEVADALATYSAMRRACTVIQTPSGAPMGWVNSDGRAEEGEQVEQNAQTSSGGDPSFGITQLRTYRYSSRLITVPFELSQDAGINLPAFLDARIASRIGRITNRKLTVGTGTGEPMGVLTAAQTAKMGAAGQTITLIYEDLEDLIDSVDDAYRESPKCGWMMHEQTLRAIARMKDTSGRPLRLVSRGADLQTRILDYPVFVNNHMPIMGAGVKSLLFGDFSTYVIRDALETKVIKLADSTLAVNGQIGFVGFARTGGSYVDVGGGIRAYQNAAS